MAKDCYTFYGQLRALQATSQHPYYAAILFIGAVTGLQATMSVYRFFHSLVPFAMRCPAAEVTAAVNCAALLLDRCRVKLPELGDRNLRLSTLAKCLLVFMKLRVACQQNTINGRWTLAMRSHVCNRVRSPRASSWCLLACECAYVWEFV